MLKAGGAPLSRPTGSRGLTVERRAEIQSDTGGKISIFPKGLYLKCSYDPEVSSVIKFSKPQFEIGSHPSYVHVSK